MSERPTPETDAKRIDVAGSVTALMGMTDHARRLERERDEARMAILGQMARETLTCGWCGEMMHAPPGFTPPMTQEKLQLTVKTHILDCPKHPIRETERERDEAIFLADGRRLLLDAQEGRHNKDKARMTNERTAAIQALIVARSALKQLTRWTNRIDCPEAYDTAVEALTLTSPQNT